MPMGRLLRGDGDTQEYHVERTPRPRAPPSPECRTPLAQGPLGPEPTPPRVQNQGPGTKAPWAQGTEDDDVEEV